MKSKLLKIPTIIGIFILIFAVATGVILVQKGQVFKLGASPEAAPKDVRITNISDNSFSVSWTTDKEVSGVIRWGTTSSNLANSESDELQDIGTVHYSTIRGLSPSSTYFFEINSGGADYDNNQNPWSVKTGPSLGNSGESQTISGTVLTATGSPASNVVIYVSASGISPLSTSTSSNGSWVLPISSARTVDLGSYKKIDDANDVVEIFVQAGSIGIASASIKPQSAKPTPPIILGQTHDFRDLPPSTSGDSPEAEIESSDKSASLSRFDVSGELPENDTTSVSIESIDEGEIVTTTRPEFFGEGPSGTEINIKLESQTPISAIATVGSSGSWRWSPPSQLTPGSHKITLSWIDDNGIARSVVKNFVVQAAEGPAFESTPSASPISTTIPGSSPSATATSSATPFPHPESGIGTPTIIFLVIGFLLISTSSLAYAFSKENHGI